MSSPFQLPQQQVLLERLQSVKLPYTPGISVASAVEQVTQSTDRLELVFRAGYPAAVLQPEIDALVRTALGKDFGTVTTRWEWGVADVRPMNNQTGIAGVRNIVAIASGKGGVGKSTITVNLALALASMGVTVGILDADIYGPSQAQMLGVSGQRPEMHSPNTMLPVRGAGGIQLMSMGNLVTENTPMVWRGPMVSGALQQLLNNTQWQDVDYLLVDMPPGTGDIQLTLSQSVPVSGSVIVTTPQDIALLDARKGIEMFRKVNIPVLGVVENMAMHICSNCGHAEAIFGEGGGERLAQDYQVEVLGRLPLRRDIREQTDSGIPPLLADPESEASQEYRRVALRLTGALWQIQRHGAQAPVFSASDD